MCVCVCVCVCLITRAAWHTCSGPGQLSRYSDSLRAGKFRESNPGGGVFPHPSGPALVPTQPFYTMGTGWLPGVKRLGRGVDRPPPSRVEVNERVQLYLYSPSGLSLSVLGWTLPAWHTCIRFTPRRCIGRLPLETLGRSSLFPSSSKFLQTISPFLYVHNLVQDIPSAVLMYLEL